MGHHRSSFFCSSSQVLDSKGIREAVQENKPMKALYSFAIRDIIDGWDKPLMAFEVTVWMKLKLDAWPVEIWGRGGLTARASKYEIASGFMMCANSSTTTLFFS